MGHRRKHNKNNVIKHNKNNVIKSNSRYLHPTDNGQPIVGTPFNLEPHRAAPWYRALHFALTHGRPAHGPNIRALGELIAGMAPMGSTPQFDGFGNLWIDTRTKLDEQKTVFMAHMDSVGRSSRIQAVYLNQESGIMWTPDGDCLGADDGAGCAILAHLMQTVPALYLFTDAEEVGGQGTSWIKQNSAYLDRIKGMDRILSFDRKGTKSICGAQGIGNCASRSFVSALAERLGMSHSWDCGTYTDSSDFRGIVPEIVNISIGYERAHGPKEYLDLGYLWGLMEALAKINFETLPIVGPAPDIDRWSGINWAGIETDRGFTWERRSRAPMYSPEDDADDLAQSLFIDRRAPEYDAIIDALMGAYNTGFSDGSRW